MNIDAELAAARLRIDAEIDYRARWMDGCISESWLRERERMSREIAFLARSIGQQRRHARERRQREGT